jgi:hypothetical protein
MSTTTNAPAVDALKFFLSKYSPGTKDDASDFFTTDQISQAIKEHTGLQLNSLLIHGVMTEMNFEYEVYNELDFTWLLKKK